MLSVVLLSALATAAPAPVAVQSNDPALRIWFNKSENFESGDRIRSYVRTRNDGYLLVLHAEPDGRVRVLFPLDPSDDNFARGGRDYEIRGRGDRQSFTIYESSGLGTVYAAFSRDPFVFDEFVLGDHWDYTLGDWNVTEDTEGELTAIVDRMAVGAGFDYDLREYQVGAQVVYAGGATYYHTLSLYDPDYYGHHWHGTSGLTIHIGLGSWYGYGYRGWGYGYPVSYWDPWYYDPFYYDPFYYGYPVVYYAPHRPRWGYPRTVVVNQPRYYGGRNYTFKSPNDRFDLTPNRARTVSRPRTTTVVRADNRRANVSSHGTIPRVVSGRRSAPAPQPATSTRARRPLTPTGATGDAPRQIGEPRETQRRAAPESQPAPTRRAAPVPTSAPSSAPRAPAASQPARRVTPAPAPRSGSTSTARPSTGRRTTESQGSRTATNRARRTTVTRPSSSAGRSTGRRVSLPSSSSRSSGSTARRVSPSSGARAMPSRATGQSRAPVRSSQPAARPAPRSSSQGAARSSPPPTRRAAPARSSSRSTSRRRN